MAEPRYIGSDKQLLLDADLVSRSDAVTRRVEFHASPDGLHWEPTHAVEIGDCDTRNLAFWDEIAGR
jgi:hypothetical protein